MALLFAAPAIAQTGPGTPVPTPAEPRPPEERLQPRPPPTTAPRLERPEAPVRGAPEGARDVTLVLQGIILEGVSAFAESAFAPFYAALIGTRVRLDQIFALAARIEARYRDEGYVLTRVLVPAQTIESGRVRIRVVEGFVGEILIRGEVGMARALIERMLARIAGERPSKIETIERYLLLVNDLPGISALGVLRAGRGGAGSTQLVVSVSRKRFDGALSVDNRGSPFVGRTGANLVVGANAMTSLAERTEVTAFSTAEIREQQFYRLSFSAPLGSDGMTASASFSASPAEPGAGLQPLGIDTMAYRGKAAIMYPAIRTRRLNLVVSGGFDATNTSLTSAGAALSANDKLRVFWGQVAFDMRDSLAGLSEFSVGFRQGVPFFGASKNSNPTPSRVEGRVDFTVIEGRVGRLQELAPGLNLQLSAAWQVARTPLLADEEFSIGGLAFGRGFDPAEFAGDDGLGGSAEFLVDPNRLMGIPLGPFAFLQLYGFVDYGRISNQQTTVNRFEELFSTGGGVRFGIGDWLTANFEVARPLKRAPSADDDGAIGSRFYFGLGARF